ncbi:ATP-binding protein [Candidatus Bathyarchaeota archaeon]|jgi:ATP-binding protein involved in chromosome partitioning|nr:ATP-binding protein [Candidatus Bathyarchaeota archaeon]MBT4321133.1 ATP-binding protein [Candidatus Bathyarchaeota archaeon]MBT4424570.1 ATP-binding protein [Candidatus Bathyarchaeota archaeon]MBT6604280.1 ATP-binding protein [Candidatus Bathyarchaeota archaeon]MBT7187448.1 ATP-binding protein [Candidatus Bathyarchaeota archaeon]
MSDPRLAVIERRFDKVGKVIAVSSGKGGVGKSMVATSLALNLRDKGFKVGLLDLDFTSPATHVILGVEGLYPKEENGIIPPVAHGIGYMSITHYSLDEPAPLRGVDVSNAIIELLAIIRWGELDYLVIDMPPGIGDATLDTIRLVPKLEFVVITTPSKVAYQSVRRLLILFKNLGINVRGVIENMVMKPGDYVRSELVKIEIDYIGALDYSEELEEAIGDPAILSETSFYKKIGKLIPKII